MTLPPSYLDEAAGGGTPDVAISWGSLRVDSEHREKALGVLSRERVHI